MATPAGLAWLNALPHDEAARALLTCCAAPAWAQRVAGERPFASTAELLAAADAAWQERPPGDLEAAMNAHPRIGEPAGAKSRREQSGVRADPRSLAALREANAAYEERFGHVFMICATGLGPDQVLSELRRRTESDPGSERQAAAVEIGKINALRLRDLAEGPAGPPAAQAPASTAADGAPDGGVSTHVLDTSRGRPAAGVRVGLDVWADGGWQPSGGSVTDADGRAAGLRVPAGDQPRTCRLVFDVHGYLLGEHGAAFFPEVSVVFTAEPGQPYHVPLLLAPFGYSVYLGS